MAIVEVKIGEVKSFQLTAVLATLVPKREEKPRGNNTIQSTNSKQSRRSKETAHENEWKESNIQKDEHDEDELELEDGETALHSVSDEDNEDNETDDGVALFGIICCRSVHESEADDIREEGEVIINSHADAVDVCVTNDCTRVFFVACELCCRCDESQKSGEDEEEARHLRGVVHSSWFLFPDEYRESFWEKEPAAG